jgi:omega-amidase
VKVKIGQVQMHITEDKDQNLENASNLIDQAVSKGADIVVLPEMFNCPYKSSFFVEFAEMKGEKTYSFLSKKAEEHKIYLVGGSIPEKTKKNNIYNTAFIFDRNGKQIGRHRKTHLFDIDVKGRQTFKESDTLTPGKSVTVVETEFGKVGIMICYDIRFPEFARMTIERGARMIIVPGAFNMTTGPAHWEMIFRARAVDNQVFMIGTAPARDVNNFYVSYGNSIIVSPWGDILNRLDGEEEVMVTEIDLDEITRIREQLPVLKQRRTDLY